MVSKCAGTSRSRKGNPARQTKTTISKTVRRTGLRIVELLAEAARAQRHSGQVATCAASPLFRLLVVAPCRTPRDSSESLDSLTLLTLTA
jgi:hypothetical protein